MTSWTCGKVGMNRHIMHIIKALLAILVSVALTVARRVDDSSRGPPIGINCLGSSQCSRVFNTISTKNLIAQFNWTLWNRVNDTAIFYSHRQIACGRNLDWLVGGVCLFLQGNVTEKGVSGAILKSRISDLTYHGCRYCGSVPVSGDNDPRSQGSLTANYVHYPVCDGLCFPGEIVEDKPAVASGASNYTTLRQEVSSLIPAAPVSFTRHQSDHSTSAESQAKETDALEMGWG